MKKNSTRIKFFTKLSKRNVLVLVVQLVFTLFVVFLGIVIRDYLLFSVVQSDQKKADTLVLEGENINIQPYSTVNYFLKANPDLSNTRVVTVRMDFSNATIVDFRAKDNFVAIGVCTNGRSFEDHKLCVDLGKLDNDIQANESVAEVTLKFEDTTNFTVAMDSGNGFYNGQVLNKNENTALNYDGLSTLPMTGEENFKGFNISDYKIFLFLSGIIILGGFAGLGYLVKGRLKSQKSSR